MKIKRNGQTIEIISTGAIRPGHIIETVYGNATVTSVEPGPNGAKVSWTRYNPHGSNFNGTSVFPHNTAEIIIS